MKKVLSVILSIFMLLSIGAGLDFSAYALDSSGQCGENAFWSFDSETGELTISGTGDMYDYYEYDQEMYNSPFAQQSNIKSVIIAEGVTSIGNCAFAQCYGLTSVTIGNSVTSIGDSAFFCSSLTSIEIPNSVTSIGYSAFFYCTSLTKVNICSIEAWCGILFANDTSNPIYYAHSLYLNDELITDLVIPNGVKSIAEKAFEYNNCLLSQKPEKY